jgi:Uncharacterized protein conserved in bacteria
MNLRIDNEFGSIELQEDIIKTMAGAATIECYGVVGMASQQFFRDGLTEILKQDNYQKGIVLRVKESIVHIDLYVIIGFDVRVSEIIHEIQKKVKYDIETALKIEVGSVNVFVQDVQR